MIIFIFSLSHPFPTYSRLKWSHKGIFWFFEFFYYFFGIFYFSSGRNKTERYFLYSLFHGILQPILAWNEAIMIFFNFLNFLLFCWNFQLHDRQERNGMKIFIFSLSHNFPTYFGLKWTHNGIFFIFSLSRHFPTYFGMKPKWYFLIFWIFLLFCWNFQLRVVQERNVMIIFIFTLSHPFPTYFRLKWSHNGIF